MKVTMSPGSIPDSSNILAASRNSCVQRVRFNDEPAAKELTTAAGHLHRFHQRLGLVHALLELHLGVGISHDAGASLDVSFAVAHQHGANGDAGIKVAGEISVKDGATVNAAAHRLEFLDDLHGPHLGRARKSSGGKASGKGI